MKRKFSHWTPKYIFNRATLFFWERKNKDAPWLCKDVVNFLSGYLTKNDVGFEWGSGRSTAWFAKRVKKLYSVEQSEDWFKRVGEKLRDDDIANVERFLLQDEKDYSGKILDIAQEFDFILIDGQFRPRCLKNAINKVRMGGVIIIDNANWFFPNNNPMPHSKRAFDLNDEDDKSLSSSLEMMSSWRKYWVSNGIWDTAIFFRPYKQALVRE